MSIGDSSSILKQVHEEVQSNLLLFLIHNILYHKFLVLRAQHGKTILFAIDYRLLLFFQSNFSFLIQVLF